VSPWDVLAAVGIVLFAVIVAVEWLT